MPLLRFWLWSSANIREKSGKSSLVGTLLRLLEIDSGSIIIDNVDITTIPRETIRRQLLAIPQESLVLIGSLRLNVDPAAAHSDEAIIRVLERVGLWILFSERGGLAADVTASSFSKGQQQLLALARALLKKGQILLLDEMTSNVDSETDAVMQRVLAEEFTNCTIITVAHRLNTIMSSDLIVVMDEGKLVEVGPPRDLLDAEGGWFQKLVKQDGSNRYAP